MQIRITIGTTVVNEAFEIVSPVDIITLLFRPMYSNMSRLSFILFLRVSRFNCPRMSEQNRKEQCHVSHMHDFAFFLRRFAPNIFEKEYSR